MRSEQSDLILELIELRETTEKLEHPYNLLIHSILNTTSFKELVFDYTNSSFPFKDSIFSNINKRKIYCTEQEAEIIYDNLKQELEEIDEYQRSQRIRKILELLLDIIEDSFKIDFFKTFFYSRYANDKKAAIRYIKFYNEDVAEELLDLYFSTLNTIFLFPILEEKNYLLLKDNIKDIWDIDFPFYIKKKIIDIIAKKSIEDLAFLKADENELYILASLIAKKISIKKAINEISKLSPTKRAYAIFNISKIVDFKTLSIEIKKYIS